MVCNVVYPKGRFIQRTISIQLWGVNNQLTNDSYKFGLSLKFYIIKYDKLLIFCIFSAAYCAHKPEIDLDDQRVVVGSSVFRFNKTEDIYAQHYEIEKIIVPKGYFLY